MFFPQSFQTPHQKGEFISKLIDKIGLGILPTIENNNKVKKWSYIYLAMLTRNWANNYSSNRERRLKDAYNEIQEAIHLKTTRTTYLLMAELILDEEFTPAGMTREEAQTFAFDNIECAFEREATKDFSSTSLASDTAPQSLIIKYARPPYLRDLKKAKGIQVSHDLRDDFEDDVLSFSPEHGVSPERHAFDEIDELAGFDYSTLAINQHLSIHDLPIRNVTINTDGMPQEPYVIHGRYFRRQNVSGQGMRCFFNTMGLHPDGQIELLKWLKNDPSVRYMIANEIVSSLANPEQIPESVKRAIGYRDYQQQLNQIDRLAHERNDLLAAQNSDPNFTNVHLLPQQYHNLDERYETLREEVRQRALSLGAIHAFLNDHIGNEAMMVALHDISGNGINNFTSIDAIAYAENIGIMIFSPTEDGTLNLVHQFVPENATAIKYIYHTGVHFQALNEVEVPENNNSPGLLSNDNNSDELLRTHDIPSKAVLQQMYPDVETTCHYVTHKAYVIRQILYLKERAKLSISEISNIVDLDQRRISEILIQNGVRYAHFLTDGVKEIVLEAYLRFYRDLQGEKITKKDFFEKVAEKINEDKASGERVKEQSLSSFIYNKSNRNPIQNVNKEEAIVQSYLSGQLILDILENQQGINSATIIDILGRNLKDNDFRDQLNLNIPKLNLSKKEKEDLIIQTFENLKKKNRGKPPSILAVKNALVAEKIGYKAVELILKDKNLVAQSIKSKHIAPEKVAKVREDYKKLNPSLGEITKTKERLAKKHGLTTIQIKDILLSGKNQTYTGNAKRTAIIQENRRVVVETYQGLSPKQQETPTTIIENILKKKGIALTRTSIRAHLKKEGLYKSNGKPGKSAKNIQIQKRDHREISSSSPESGSSEENEEKSKSKRQRK